MIDHRGVVIAHLSTFRPSDRAALKSLLDDSAHRNETLAAIRFFIEEWEGADWLEAYSLERMGRWIGKTQPQPVIDNLEQWATLKPSDARRALAAGLAIGASERSIQLS